VSNYRKQYEQCSSKGGSHTVVATLCYYNLYHVLVKKTDSK